MIQSVFHFAFIPSQYFSHAFCSRVANPEVGFMHRKLLCIKMLEVLPDLCPHSTQPQFCPDMKKVGTTLEESNPKL